MILDSSDFKVVDRLDLSKARRIPGQEMENVGFGGELESIAEPGRHIALFNSFRSHRPQSRLQESPVSI